MKNYSYKDLDFIESERQKNLDYLNRIESLKIKDRREGLTVLESIELHKFYENKKLFGEYY